MSDGYLWIMEKHNTQIDGEVIKIQVKEQVLIQKGVRLLEGPRLTELGQCNAPFAW